MFFFSSKCSWFHNSNIFGSSIIHILYMGCAKIKKLFRRQKVNIVQQSSVGDGLYEFMLLNTWIFLAHCYHLLVYFRSTEHSGLQYKLCRSVRSIFFPILFLSIVSNRGNENVCVSPPCQGTAVWGRWVCQVPQHRIWCQALKRRNFLIIWETVNILILYAGVS